MQWVCVVVEDLHHGVTSLVVGGSDAFLLFDLAALLCATPTNLVAGLFKVHHLDDIFVGHGGDDGRFINERGQVCAAETWRSACDLVQVDVWPKLHLLGMNAKNLPPSHHIRRADTNHAVKSTRAGQGRVEHISTIGCSNDDDLVRGLEAVHLYQDGIECLLTLIMTT